MSRSDSQSSFLLACAGQKTAVTPVWLMRQAGRILKPYRDLREKYESITTLFKTPELATQITLMPVEILEVDAAILFTDLVTPLEALGCPYEYDPGPVFTRPLRTADDVEALRPLDTRADLPFVLETIRLTRRELSPAVPLIGYGGAPFTLAAWLVEGKSSKDFSFLRRLLYSAPETAHLLLDKLTDAVVDFLTAQVEAGAQAIQLFDTSIGLLSADAFQRFALPYLQRIFAALADLHVPRIYFPLDASHLLPLLNQTGADVLSIDWRTDLDQAFELFSPELVLQGNLDPCALYAPTDILVAEVHRILKSADGRPHIFNLGHGLLPDIPCDNVRVLVDAVHEYSTRGI